MNVRTLMIQYHRVTQITHRNREGYKRHCLLEINLPHFKKERPIVYPRQGTAKVLAYERGKERDENQHLVIKKILGLTFLMSEVI